MGIDPRVDGGGGGARELASTLEGMEEARGGSLLKRTLAVIVLICVGLLALKLVAGVVIGLVTMVFYVLVAVFVLAAVVWAVRHL